MKPSKEIPPAKSLSECPPGKLVTTNNPQCSTCVKLMRQRDETQRKYDNLCRVVRAAGKVIEGFGVDVTGL